MARPRIVAALVMSVAIAAVASAQLPGPQPGGAPAGARRQTPARAGAATDEAKGTAIIRGFVVAADNGQPLRRAQVRLTSPETRESRLATTDSQGRFEARELGAGRYTITASKGGFVPLQYGQRRPSEQGTPIVIGDAQVIERIVIALPRGSVISGRITDEFGEPVANAVVSAVRYGYAGGTRRALPAGGQNARDTTDDLGQFRLFGLSPGEYYVTAAFRMGGGEVTDPAQDVTGFAPTYYPGVSGVGEAQRVAVGIGQETMNVSFALIATRLVRITGTVMDSSGAPANGGSVVLVPTDMRGAMPMMQGGNGRIEATGRFRLTNVAPGRYTLQTRPGRQSLEIGRLPVTVGGEDLENLVLVTSPGATVSGRVVGPTGQPPPLTPRDINITARPADLNRMEMAGANAMPFDQTRSARVEPAWTFELGGLIDGRIFRVNAPQGWALESVSLNGQDVTDSPIELSAGQKVTGLVIALTDRLTDLSGAVTDSRGQPVLDASIVVFPSDDRLWTSQSRFIRVARPDQAGRYQIRGLPAHADYLAAAVQGLEDGQANDPEFLATARAVATSLALARGETKVVDLRMK